MNIVIIEGENLVYEKIAELIKEIIPASQIVAHHSTIESALRWFSQSPVPDLVLTDIQLSDGSPIDLLKLVAIDCPVIFTNACDKRAIAEYNARSIGYPLKPHRNPELKNALQKVKKIRTALHIQERSDLHFNGVGRYKERFLIRQGKHLKLLLAEDIAYCYSETKRTYVCLRNKDIFRLAYSLDIFERMLKPSDFFRVNRKYIVSFKAVVAMKTHRNIGITVEMDPAAKEQIIVSSERSVHFKKWLSGELQ